MIKITMALLSATLTAGATLTSSLAADELDFLFEDEQPTSSEVDKGSTPQTPSENSPAKPMPRSSGPSVEQAEQPASSAERPRTAGKRLVLEEIVVTAQKREQSLIDVPVSVTAVSGKKLSDAGIENLSDMSEYTPNFKLVDAGLIPNVYMRGVGSGSNQGFELSVGMFADSIHLGRPHQTRAAFMDVERVEVLRGPQSILFGKNAIAGALNIISATPSDEFESEISAAVGVPHQDSELFGVVSGPVSETLGARFAVRQRGENGYLYNQTTRRTEPGIDELAARGTFNLRLGEDVDTSLKLEHTRRRQNGRTFQPVDAGALTGCSGAETNFDLVRDTNIDETATIEAYNATLSVDVPMGDGSLAFVTGASGFDSLDLYDADASSIDTIYLLGQEYYDQLSQEVRFTSPLGDTLNYIVGAFIQQSDLLFTEFGPLVARVGALGDQGACLANNLVLAQADLDRVFSIGSKAWSAFGQATINLTETFRTTFGLRYVKEDKQGARDFNAYASGTKNPVDPVTAVALDTLLINSHSLSDSRSVGILLPSINVQWDLNDDIMTYATATRGAKSGSYDARNNNDNSGPTGGGDNFEFDDEVADAFEIGSKMRLAGGRAELNIAAYLVNYDNIQVSVFDGVAGFTVTNAGKARIQGVELDGRFLATDHLMVNGALAYLDFTWTDYIDGPCYHNAPNEDPDTGTCDLTGRENQQTPAWTASLSTTWTQPIFNNLVLDITLDSNYRGDHFTSGDLDPRGIQKAHFKFNSRISLGPADDRWAVALVAKNLSDELTRGIGAPIPLDSGGYMTTTEKNGTVSLEARALF